MTFDEANGDIVVVRDDAIHYYGVNGRGPSFAYEGPKQLVSIFGDYVGIVSPPKTATPTRTNGLRRFGGNRADELFNTSTFALLDTDLKFIAHTETLVSQVKALFIEWGDLFLLTLDGKVGHLLSGPRLVTDFHSFLDTTKSLCNKNWKYSISAIYMYWPSILLRKLALIPLSAT